MSEIEFTSEVIVKLLKHMASDDDVVQAARVSTQGENTPVGEAAGLINFLMANRHGTPFEHTAFKFYVRAPIFVWREWMRHRIGFSYNEESGRYKQLDPVFYVPAPDRPLVQVGKPGAYTFEPGTENQWSVLCNDLMYSAQIAYERYERQMELGVAKEVARMMLPVNIMSSAYVTCNARSIMSFLSLRTKHENSTFPSFPQREIEMAAEKVEAAFAEHMPITHEAFHRNGRVAP